MFKVTILCILILSTSNVYSAKFSVKFIQTHDASLSDVKGVTSSKEKGNLFELWFIVDDENMTITRTYIRRLDQNEGQQDQTTYKIIKTTALTPEKTNVSKEENVIIAVGEPGLGNVETIWMGTETMYSCRNSGMFHFNICGIYKRIK